MAPPPGTTALWRFPLRTGRPTRIYKNSNTRREKYLYAIFKKMQSLGAQAKSGDTRESGKAWVELYMCR